MAESKNRIGHEFWLFHEDIETELIELRKFIDPEMDISSLKGISELIDKLYHPLE